MAKRKTAKNTTAKPRSKPRTPRRGATGSPRNLEPPYRKLEENLEPTLGKIEKDLLAALRQFGEESLSRCAVHTVAGLVEDATDGIACVQDIRTALRAGETNDAVLFALQAGVFYQNVQSRDAVERYVRAQRPIAALRISTATRFGTQEDRCERARKINTEAKELHSRYPNVSLTEARRRCAEKHGTTLESFYKAWRLAKLSR